MINSSENKYKEDQEPREVVVTHEEAEEQHEKREEEEEFDQKSSLTTSTETSSGHQSSWFVEAYSPDPTISWEDKSLECGFWSYHDPEVEKEFDRFFFRDQTSLPLGMGFFLGYLATPLLAEANGNRSTDFYYLLPTSPFWLGCVIVDQIFYLKKSLKNHPWRIRIRQIISLLFAYAPIHGGAWYALYILTNCGPDLRGPEASAFTKERICTEKIEPFAIVPLAAIPILAKVKLLHQWLLLAATLISMFILTAVEGYSFYTYGAKQIVATVVVYSAITLGFLSIGTMRYRSVRVQFEKSIAVVIAKKEMLDRQAIVDTLLESLVPQEVLPRLMDTELQDGGEEDAKGVPQKISHVPRGVNNDIIDFEPESSILFSDIVSFTKWSNSRTASQVVTMLNTLVTEFDQAAAATHGIERVKTIGDAYWAVCGMPLPVDDHAYLLTSFGQEMLQIVSKNNHIHPEWSSSSIKNQGSGGINLRIGIHSGRLSGAILGKKQVAYEVFGENNTIAGVVEQNGAPGHVAVTEQVLLASRFYQLQTVAWPPGTPDVAKLPNGTEYRRVKNPTFLDNNHDTGNNDESSKGEELALSPTATSPTRRGLLMSHQSIPHSDIAGGGIVPAGEEIKIFLLAKEKLQGNGGDSSSTASTVRSMVSRQSRVSAQSGQLNFSGHVNKKKKSKKGKKYQDEQERKEKERREQFLKALRERRQLAEVGRPVDEGGDEASSAISGWTASTATNTMNSNWLIQQKRLSTRRFTSCCFGLKDPSAEQEFEQFILDQSATVRFSARCCSLTLLVLYLIFLLVDGRNLDPVTVVLWIVGCLAAVPPVLITSPLLRTRYPLADFVLSLGSHFLFLIGAGLMLVPVKSESVNMMVNSAPAIFAISILPVFCSSVAVPWGAVPTVFCGFCVLGLPTIGITLLAGEDVPKIFTVVVLCSACCLLYLVITEKVCRTTFLDQRRTEFLSKEAKQHSQTSEGVLEKLVPRHVIPPLMEWISSGMSPEQSLAVDYDQIVIGFIKLTEPTLVTELLLNNGRNSSHSNNANNNSTTSGSFLSKRQLDLMDFHQQNNNASSGPQQQQQSNLLGTSSSSLQQQQCEAVQAQSWLLKAHKAIDDLLSSDDASYLTKVKTVGDLVMIAGPFQQQQEGKSSSSVSDLLLVRRAARQLLVVSAALARNPEKYGIGGVTVGLHVGPVMAAVLGTVRPMFDIFGDTVNTTSRTMTVGATSAADSSSAASSSLSSVACSSPFVALVSSKDRSGSSGSCSTTSSTERPLPNSVVGSSGEECEGNTATNTSGGGTVVEMITKTTSSTTEEDTIAPTTTRRDISEGDAVFSFGEEIQAEAKGKGTISIRKLSLLDKE